MFVCVFAYFLVPQRYFICQRKESKYNCIPQKKDPNIFVFIIATKKTQNIFICSSKTSP